MKLFVLIEFVLAKLDFVFGFARPIFGLGFALEMLADCGVAFDADDCAPSVAVFAFVDRCHVPTLGLWFWAGLQCWIKLRAVAPLLHRMRKKHAEMGISEQGFAH